MVAPMSMLLSWPKYNKIRAGVMKTPKTLPKLALKRAEASLPPLLFVITITIFTVIGSETQITMPSARSLFSPTTLISALDIPKTIIDTTPKFMNYTKRLNLKLAKAFLSSLDLREMPDIIKMKMTAQYEAVMWGAR